MGLLLSDKKGARNMKNAVFLLFTLFFVSNLHAQELKQDKKLLKGCLENGMQYYVYPCQKPEKKAYFRLYVKAGSAYENQEQRGLAHFLEHMAFNGTNHFKGNRLIEFLESKGATFGGDINAHTSYNETVYKLFLPSDDTSLIDSTLCILSDWAGGFLLDGDEIEKERGVIFSEWRSKQGPQNEANTALLNNLLNGSRYAARKVIGDTAVILHCSHQVMKEFYSTWYRPELMAVAVVGDVNPKQIERKIKKWFGGLTNNSDKKAIVYNIPNFEENDYQVISHESFKEADFSMIQLIDKADSINNESAYKKYLIRYFSRALIKQRFNSLIAEYTTYTKPSASISNFLNVKGTFMLGCTLKRGKLKDGIIEYCTELHRIFRYGFTKSELYKIKRSYAAELERLSLLKSPRSSKTLLNEVKGDFFSANLIVDKKEEFRLFNKYISAVDSSSVLSYLNSINDFERIHYSISCPEELKSQLPSKLELYHLMDSIKQSELAPYEKSVKLHEQLLPQLPKRGTIVKRNKLKAINATELVLSNGAKLIYRKAEGNNGRTYLQGWRKGGLYALDSTNYVNGQYTRAIVGMSGAGQFSREELSTFLTGNSASLQMLIEKTRVGIYGRSDSKKCETMFQLLYLKWKYAKVDSTEFNKIRKKLIEKCDSKIITDKDLFYKDFARLVNGDNYTKRELTSDIVRNELKSEAILPLYNQCFGSAKDFTFVLISDLPLNKLKPYIEKYIASLPEGDVNLIYKYDAKPNFGTDVSFSRSVGDSPKAIVTVIAQQECLNSDLRQQRIEVDILQSLIRKLLLVKLREEMGSIYSVSVSGGIAKYPHAFQRYTIRFNCKSAEAETLIRVVKDELQRVVDNPESISEELKNIKESMITKYETKITSDSYWSGTIRNTLFNENLDWKYTTDYVDIIRGINEADIVKALQNSFIDQPLIRGILYPKSNKDTAQK